MAMEVRIWAEAMVEAIIINPVWEDTMTMVSEDLLNKQHSQSNGTTQSALHQ